MARKTPEQRLAEATQARLRAEFDILAERGAAAGMTAREVRAIRCALDLFAVIGLGADDVGTYQEDIDVHISALEADQEARAATKAVGK
jgi:hypothetical protein